MYRIRKLISGEKGAEIAEAAAVLPLLMMVLLGIYWFGRAYNVYATINHAAIEGARAAAAPSCASCGNSTLAVNTVADRVSQALMASKLDPGLVTSSAFGSRPSCIPGVSSPCLSPTSGPNICVYYNLQLYAAGGGEPQACGVGVSFEYPYQFYFPFTSLHMQQIHMPAEVQMKGEH